jgi:hypothetical protein
MFMQITFPCHSLVTDGEGDTLTRAFVQYCFDDREHSVSVLPHGNSRKKEAKHSSGTKKAACNLNPKLLFAKCHHMLVFLLLQVLEFFQEIDHRHLIFVAGQLMQAVLYVSRRRMSYFPLC